MHHNVKQLPLRFPPVLRKLYEHGYTAKSGNHARLMVTEGKKQNKHGITTVWDRDPSPEDKREITQILSAGMTVRNLLPDGATQTVDAVLKATLKALEE